MILAGQVTNGRDVSDLCQNPLIRTNAPLVRASVTV